MDFEFSYSAVYDTQYYRITYPDTWSVYTGDKQNWEGVLVPIDNTPGVSHAFQTFLNTPFCCSNVISKVQQVMNGYPNHSLLRVIANDQHSYEILFSTVENGMEYYHQTGVLDDQGKNIIAYEFVAPPAAYNLWMTTLGFKVYYQHKVPSSTSTDAFLNDLKKGQEERDYIQSQMDIMQKSSDYQHELSEKNYEEDKKRYAEQREQDRINHERLDHQREQDRINHERMNDDR
jgi:hypothetical protein